MSAAAILYSFRRCPYAMRARLALLVSGQDVEIREVKLRDKPPPMLAASPKGTVPVLVLPDGPVIDQSLDIMRWALARGDPGGWLARDDPVLVAANDGPFKHHLDGYKYAQRHDADPLAQRAAGVDFLTALEGRLMLSPQLCGMAPGLADMAIFPFVRQFAAVDPNWFAGTDLPLLRQWLAGHGASDLFNRAMVRLPPWQVGDAPVTFG